MSETTQTLILNSPLDIINHINKRLAEDRFAHIEVKNYENKGVFDAFVSRAKLWYDTNICSCKKKGLNEQVVMTEYENLKSMNDGEKKKARRILGVSTELHHQGEVIVKLP